MLDYLLLFLALGVTAISLLTVVRAPDWIIAWKTAILCGEYGHWLVVIPITLAAVAATGTTGVWRSVILVLCLAAAACLLRPAFSAARIAASMPRGINQAFGCGIPSQPPFSWGRLYTGTRRPRASVATEVFARPDGQELKLDFYHPLSPGYPVTGGRPCVIVIHGGGWDGGDRTQLPEWNHWLVARGYQVAAISYRLAPKWKWPAQGDDVLAAVAWLKANAIALGIDPGRFVLLGRSAGGQIASAVGFGAIDPAIRGVVALYAPHDMPFVWSVAREDDALNSANLMRQYMGGPPEGSRQQDYDSASAQRLAGPDSPPTLLVHGVPDTLSWVRHSEKLAARLQELGVPHYYLCLPWATHAFDFNADGPGSQLAGYALERFLSKVMQEA